MKIDFDSSVDPHKIFRCAEMFNSAVLLLNLHLLGSPNFNLPYCVMGAFTLELYLKCLLKLQCKTFPVTHDLAELFRNLPRATRDSLRKEHDSRAENDPAFAHFRQQFGLKTDLDSLLETGRNVFEVLRYRHEGEPTGTWALNIFTWCVQQKILSLHPAFATRYRTTGKQSSYASGFRTISDTKTAYSCASLQSAGFAILSLTRSLARTCDEIAQRPEIS